MEDLFTAPAEKLSMGIRTLRDEIKKRGWKKARFVKGTGTYIILTRPDGKEIIFGYGTPPTMTYGSGMLADDKYATYAMLKEIDVKQPETILLDEHSDLDKELGDFMTKQSPIVLKPVDGAHGNDVFVGVTDIEEAKKHVAVIIPHSYAGMALAQQQLFPKNVEVRVIVIDYKFVKAYARIPACVTGDGEHSVLELIDIENQTKRTAKYQSNLSYINKENAVKYLRGQALAKGLSETALLDAVPDAGEKVQVISICNTGQGGTMEDTTDIFPEELKRQSERIAKHLNLPLVGVDYLDDYVIEVNKAPGLYHPVEGKAATICIEKLVDYLEKIPA